VGGPPCQGFSFAGRRNPDDPRNLLFRRYLDVVRIVRPSAVLIENVPGMAVAHGTSKSLDKRLPGEGTGSYFEALKQGLDDLGYDVDGRIVDASRFGVPQKRTRLIVAGLLRDRCAKHQKANLASLVFDALEEQRIGFIARLGLSVPVSAQEAIGDLTLRRRHGGEWLLQECLDPESPWGFVELAYDGRRSKSPYQKLMRSGAPVPFMDSMRLARHTDEVRKRFREIIRTCRQGVRMNEDDRASFKLRKHRIYPMSPDEPAPTVTTLPDDILHYCDPRILTVRECARLQSFPDWFVFRGKYTTGGNLRTRECPRYTQAGNAVPPLLALALANAVRSVLEATSKLSPAGAPGGAHELEVAVA
jgi:DNA (cytosine-5)-methyltransferase 1